MKKIKNKNIQLILELSILVIFVIILMFVNRPQIKFKDEYKILEYGTEYTYADMIESIKPEDAEIIYPEILATEVGKYKLTFELKKGDKIYSDDFSFIIKDTLSPLLTLYFMDENIQVHLNDKNVDVLANIHMIENLNEKVMLNKVQLSEDEFNDLVEKVKVTNQNINAREISNPSKIKKFNVPKNGIYYTTDLDVTKVGTYIIKVLVVDENYNSVETQWGFDVVESDQLLNSGGSVSCNYKGDELKESEAYSVTSVENYKYNPFKLVTYYEIITSMTFSDDYDTDENISLMIKELKNRYGIYNEVDGVSISITNKGNVVTTSIKIDLLKYDKEEDELGIIVSDSNSEIDMMSILLNAEENKYICTFK